MNDVGLQQNGGNQHVTIEYHNRFGTNLSKAQGTIGNWSHRV
jgi:hypothetical protein